MRLELLFPVYNEHKRLEAGIHKAGAHLEDLCRNTGFDDVSWHFMIIDNGSVDDTAEIGRKLEKERPDRITFVSIPEKGLGAAFRYGVKAVNADPGPVPGELTVTGYMDIDLSTDLEALERTIRLFQEDPETVYVNGTRFSKDSKTIGRKWYRKITSAGLVFILRHYLKMKVTDALCGFTFIEAGEAYRLVSECTDDNGWFYMVELLLRAERHGLKITDLPVTFTEDYNSTVNIPETIRNYLVRMRRLKREFRKEDASKN